MVVLFHIGKMEYDILTLLWKKKKPSQSQTQSTNSSRTEMTYIILRDTFGDGLETISNIGVDVIEKHQLNEYICAAAEIVANEEGYETLNTCIEESTLPMEETLVICEIVETIKDKSVDTYIRDVLKGQEEKQNKEEYELYLKLKKKFENDT